MNKCLRKKGRVRASDIRVPVFPEEREIIEGRARDAGKSVARYLRELGQGCPLDGNEVARTN